MVIGKTSWIQEKWIHLEVSASHKQRLHEMPRGQHNWPLIHWLPSSALTTAEFLSKSLGADIQNLSIQYSGNLFAQIASPGWILADRSAMSNKRVLTPDKMTSLNQFAESTSNLNQVMVLGQFWPRISETACSLSVKTYASVLCNLTCLTQSGRNFGGPMKKKQKRAQTENGKSALGFSAINYEVGCKWKITHDLVQTAGKSVWDPFQNPKLPLIMSFCQWMMRIMARNGGPPVQERPETCNLAPSGERPGKEITLFRCLFSLQRLTTAKHGLRQLSGSTWHGF